MSIKPAKVERDDDGYWVHPDMPEWDECVSEETITSWFDNNNLGCHIDLFEYSDTATDELQERYYADGDCDISEWEPDCNIKGAFLLSIHDTESGPVGVFAYPKDYDDD